ncbi:histidine kinase [Haloterrigena turkmenica DSM 5511]|uniref:histidine kinase n=1 Tax=Haloterrigena turkmenica (strain ATCC 51198 / DSM 5511 / JCM 9101 / NCIMB 13204 / VKM B-1734 / 4k) TaxID=543526 RepID=D2RT53_HALTV|nr:MEDS domain-containing protein [Haloterrigena turkmenica]ADB60933.1 histidine kinase [Haloterrigena turkmenica DSM 5511]
MCSFGHDEQTAVDVQSGDSNGPLGLESGLDALRSSPEFRGPVESLGEHEPNEHLAVIYENRDEQLAAVVPFMRQGLERGERCMYVVNEHAEAEMIAAMEDGGIDVDAAMETGALTFHTVRETYLRNGRFDPDDMLDRYESAIEEATADYEGLRISAETTWILDEGTSLEQFMEYESRVNDLFDGADCIALCQYDRDVIPAEILCDIVRTHPHLVYDGAVCHNFYYTPPSEFFDDGCPDREVDRMLGTLHERTTAKAERDETIDALEESNDQLKRFAYIASHDLQEPLRMVSSYLQLLERNYRDGLDADAREYIDFAVGGADRMREMIDGLLEFSRIETGETTLERVDCEDVVETVVTDHQVQIEESGATVEIGSLPTVSGDRTQLEQLFSNLIGNAIKYRGDEPPCIEVDATKRGSEWRLTVADNGIGIDPEYHDQIFDVFNRLHAIGEFPGTGIGLALCRKIVANHGGEIGVDSEPGEGTTFTVMLPAVAPNP